MHLSMHMQLDQTVLPNDSSTMATEVYDWVYMYTRKTMPSEK